MISMTKTALFLLVATSIFAAGAVQASTKTPTAFKQEMRARLNRLGLRDKKNARIHARLENSVGLSGLRMARLQRKNRNKKSPKTLLEKYEKKASAFAIKLSEQTPATQLHLARLAAHITRNSLLSMSIVEEAFTKASGDGALTAELLILVRDAMEIAALSLQILECDPINGNANIIDIEEKVTAPLLGYKLKDWFNAQLSNATKKDPDDAILALLTGLVLE